MKSIYSRYKATVNMTYTELLRWSKSPCSRKASLDRTPIQRNLRLLSKPAREWNKQDERDALKTIAFIARMKAVNSGRPISKDCRMSKRTASLKNWAYDPNK